MKNTILLALFLLPSTLHAGDELVRCATQKNCSLDGICNPHSRSLSLVVLDDFPRYVLDTKDNSLIELGVSEDTLSVYWEHERTKNTIIFSTKDPVWVREDSQNDEAVIVSRLSCEE